LQWCQIDSNRLTDMASSVLELAIIDQEVLRHLFPRSHYAPLLSDPPMRPAQRLLERTVDDEKRSGAEYLGCGLRENDRAQGGRRCSDFDNPV
jgi:hypothetical protein